ncbi:MAG: exodeoxyribonuclease V subunit alpha [Balneolaceae bacterium]|nr:exodeoxyribonuclease V subunit alpha [Balneolaceae bacterium]
MTQLSFPMDGNQANAAQSDELYSTADLSERAMIRFLEQEYGSLTKDQRTCLTFLSLFLKAGHVRLPLDQSPVQWARELELDEDLIDTLPNQPIDPEQLKSGPMFGKPGERKPFLIEEDSVYIHRYRRYENELIQRLNLMSRERPVQGGDGDKKRILHDLFHAIPGVVNHQMAAAALSLIKPLLFISGGPGTGKTTTVARILALHQKLAGQPLRVALAAPTGKAAGRMGEALHSQLEMLDLSEGERSLFPKEAVTVHRLLSGTRQRGLLPEPEKKELRYDLIVVDEASMIDLTMMHRLVSHTSSKTRLILLGDRHQLASVEAGSVFADLCRKQENRFSTSTARFLNKMGIENVVEDKNIDTLQDSVSYLTRSYRFDPEKGIGRLSALVLEGGSSPEEILQVVDESDELEFQPFNYEDKENVGALLNRLSGRMVNSLKLDDPKEMIRQQKEEGWLVSLRRGPAGSERLNRALEDRLPASVRQTRRGEWYHGRPVMITQNDYRLGIFNGDTGACLREENGSYKVWIESGDRLKPFRPEQLRNYTPAYFMTVHKSQGSEFERVNFLLPKEENPVFTRELIYTAITRAKKSVRIFGSAKILSAGITRKTARYSGLNR